MRHLIPIHSHSFQRLASALNHPCLLTEHASSDRDRQYEAVIVFVALGELQITREKTDIQRPPDSRMNRLPKHFDRLSLVDTIGQLSWSQGPPKQSPATPSQSIIGACLLRHFRTPRPTCLFLSSTYPLLYCRALACCHRPVKTLSIITTARAPRLCSKRANSKHRQAGLHRRA
jgi:hypothetical protein